MSRSPFQRFISELRRRHVPQTAAVYLVAAWAAIEFADVVVPNLNGPQWVVTAVIVAALVGLPVMLVVAWVFEWGPEGFHRTEPAPGWLVAPRVEDDEGRDTSMAPASMAGSSSPRFRPWIAAVAVLVIGIGSALGVAYVLRSDGAAGPGAGPSVEMKGPGGGDAGAPDSAARFDTRRQPSVPPTPPADIRGVEGFIPDSVREQLRRALGELDTLNLSELAELGSRAARAAGLGVVIHAPRQWRIGDEVPATLAEGDTLRVEGVAFDTAGVVVVSVDGEEIVALATPRATVPFAATLRGVGSAGIRVVTVVARTADGREIRREYRIVQLPGGTP